MMNASGTINKSNASNNQELPWYKQFWPWFLIVLPGSVVVASVMTMIIAINNPHIMVKDNYYKEGLAINRNLELDKRAQQLGLQAQISFSNTYPTCTLAHNDDYEAPEQLSLKMLHPVDSARDITLTLNQQPDGRYTADSKVDSEEIQALHWYIQLAPVATQDEWQLKGAGSLLNQGIISLSYN